MYADVVLNRPIAPLTYEIPFRLLSLSSDPESHRTVSHVNPSIETPPRELSTDELSASTFQPQESRAPQERCAFPGMRVAVTLRGRPATGIIYRITETTTLREVKPVEKILDTEPVLNDDLIRLGEWIAEYYLCSIGEALWTIVPRGFKRREKHVLKEYGFDRALAGEGITLTEEQTEVFSRLLQSLDEKHARHFLLHGVTGSGKTEIYLRIIHEVLERGRGAILLVPEISLTPQTVEYFSKRMGSELAILHSRLTRAEKINEWHRILSGDRRVVIGARSAIFAPLKDIGIIIIDEEHETSYKSDETPRYNAKSVAYFRAKVHNAALLFGSATPSIESFYFAKMNRFTLLTLSRRVLNQKLPSTHIADLRRLRGGRYISNPLFKAIERRLKQSEQVILFLNRRGFSPYVHCENCGYIFKCKNCDITLTYHKTKGTMICHYCGYSESPRDLCPVCSDERILYSGFGTQKIEKALHEYFPAAVVVRMDTDTVKKRNSLSHILSEFSKKHIDILIGTQIVTKGLHFPDVTLVGVLNADIPLNFPDFRSAERTFNLITQVSGRAGRSQKGGEVIIQTYNPVHYTIQTAKNQDYEEFFSREIKYRENLIYPPFCRIVRLVFRGVDSKKLFDAAYCAISFIQERTKSYISLLGPAFCPLSRIKNNYRVHVIIKLDQLTGMREILRELQAKIVKRQGHYLEIDIDPVSML